MRLRIGRLVFGVMLYRCGAFSVLHVNLNGREMVTRWEGMPR